MVGRLMNRLSRFSHEQLWFLRQVRSNDLMLDIGYGLNPSIRANVLCEKLSPEIIERMGSAVAGRPLVLGEVEALPFRDHAFDYSACSQTLENLHEPEHALAELQRVSKRGRIEIESPLAKTHRDEDDRLWHSRLQNGKLHFIEKSQSDVQERLLEQKEDPAPVYYWENEIHAEVQRRDSNPTSSPAQTTQRDLPDMDTLLHQEKIAQRSAPHPWQWRHGRDVEEWLKYTLARRFNHPGDILHLLACPACKGPLEKTDERSLLCPKCNVFYPLFENTPCLLREYGQPKSF